jgi:hypothetical protein
LAPVIFWVPSFHWYWRLVPVAVTVRVTLVPAACVVSAAGCPVICGAITVPPELEELEEDELLLDDDELELEDEEELLELDEDEPVPPELPPDDELELLDELDDDDELLEEEEELEDDELELPEVVVISAVVMV